MKYLFQSNNMMKYNTSEQKEKYYLVGAPGVGKPLLQKG